MPMPGWALHFFLKTWTIHLLPLSLPGALMSLPTVSLLLLDVDGVLTDGGIIRDDAGQQIKRFHVRDGAGIVLWRRLQKEVAIITGKESNVVALRAEELGIEHVYQNVGNKLEVYDQIKDELG